MQAGYFNAAWQDVRNSPGWVGKVLLLALVSLIPVFGWIVVTGYLLGWARDAAWGVRSPLPENVFGNEDGKLYSRGFFAWIVGAVFALAPLVVLFVGSITTGIGVSGLFSWHHGAWAPLSVGLASGFASVAFAAAAVAVSILALLFKWVGWMRLSVYGRLSAGFQCGRIWAMIRHDTGGLLRIVGMQLLIGVVAGVVMFMVVVATMMGGVAVMALVAGLGAQSLPAGACVLLIALLFLVALLLAYVSVVLSVFAEMMVLRALGHWTRQFDVPHWRGQDDPMPFEVARGTQAAR